jgi:hypothetical protein
MRESRITIDDTFAKNYLRMYRKISNYLKVALLSGGLVLLAYLFFF